MALTHHHYNVNYLNFKPKKMNGFSFNDPSMKTYAAY